MIHYRNKDTLQILLKRQGSVFRKAVPPAVAAAAIAFCLGTAEVRMPPTEGEDVDLGSEPPKQSWLGVSMPKVSHPFAIQIYAIVLGYVLVFRTSMSLKRYRDGLNQLQVMASKWADAHCMYRAFENAERSKTTDPVRMRKLDELGASMLHWFTLLHGVAMCAVCVEDGIPLAVSDEDCHLEFLPIPARTASASLGLDATGKALTIPPALTLEPVAKNHKEVKFQVIGHMTRAEEVELIRGLELTSMVTSWIQEGLTRAQREGLLGDVPPPILSRFYQEVSNGMLAYGQAYTITSVPFPFPFAQILVALLTVFCALCPFMVVHMTDGRMWPTGLSFLAVLSYYAVNYISLELEQPFGLDTNDLPIVDFHRHFVDVTRRNYLALPMLLSSITETEKADHEESCLVDDGTEALNAQLDAWGVPKMKAGRSLRFNLRLQDLHALSLEDLLAKLGADDIDLAIAVRAKIHELGKHPGGAPTKDTSCDHPLSDFELPEALQSDDRAASPLAELQKRLSVTPSKSGPLRIDTL